MSTTNDQFGHSLQDTVRRELCRNWNLLDANHIQRLLAALLPCSDGLGCLSGLQHGLWDRTEILLDICCSTSFRVLLIVGRCDMRSTCGCSTLVPTSFRFLFLLDPLALSVYKSRLACRSVSSYPRPQWPENAHNSKTQSSSLPVAHTTSAHLARASASTISTAAKVSRSRSWPTSSKSASPAHRHHHRVTRPRDAEDPDSFVRRKEVST